MKRNVNILNYWFVLGVLRQNRIFLYISISYSLSEGWGQAAVKKRSIVTIKNGTIIEPCKNIVCYNGGTCVDGVCQCPAGFGGASCTDKWNDAYVGTYEANDQCDVTNKYFVTIFDVRRLAFEDELGLGFQYNPARMQQSEFLNVVMPFKDKLFRLAKRLLVSKEEAEDATQEVILKLWTKNKDFMSYNNVEAFAMTMTKNFCLDRLKSKQANNLKLVHSNYQDGNSSLQRQLETKDSVGWVQKIMEGLPEQQKLVLQLRDVEEYDFEEISEMLDMQPTAVRVTLSRARKAVREKLVQKHSYGIG